jgi:hypothetical protein
MLYSASRAARVHARDADHGVVSIAIGLQKAGPGGNLKWNHFDI